MEVCSGGWRRRSVEAGSGVRWMSIVEVVGGRSRWSVEVGNGGW